MDEQVLAAMQKWPNVPAAYGWLSLSARGLWRFHHDGDFAANPEGESIENSQLNNFFNRNYCVDDKGAWYIQNGPQKAFVNLPYAPFILFYDDAQQCLNTHHGQLINCIKQWYFSDDGRLFAITDIGPAMLIGRDLPLFLDKALVIAENDTIVGSRTLTEDDLLELTNGKQLTLTLGQLSAPCSFFESNKAEEILGFVSQPKPQNKP